MAWRDGGRCGVVVAVCRGMACMRSAARMTVMQVRRESRLGSVEDDPAFMIGEEIAGRMDWGEGKQRTRIPEVFGQDVMPG